MAMQRHSGSINCCLTCSLTACLDAQQRPHGVLSTLANLHDPILRRPMPRALCCMQINAEGIFRYASVPWFAAALQLLANSGVHGVAVDVWVSVNWAQTLALLQLEFVDNCAELLATAGVTPAGA